MTPISLPWPPSKLSPNARIHWAPLAKLKAAYRTECWAISGPQKPALPEVGPIPIRIVFRPPDRRTRDRDNMIASFKAGADGLADGLGVNDARFEPTYAVGEPVKGGRVEVYL